MRGKLLNISLFLLLICIGFGIAFFAINSSPKTVEKILENRNVTITDTGIAAAVDKIYDSVVLVKVSSGRTSGFGSGFVYKVDDKTAYIITNHHVIEDATKVTVEFMDSDKEYSATIVGSDEYADVAVIKIDAPEGVKTVTIGNVDDLELGDTVFTVGTPVETTYKGTVTRGIVSGKQRLIPIAVKSSYSYDYLMAAIQTDATINGGNSGGPLCNANGEVIGINTMKLASSQIEGMSFAISIDQVIEVIDDILKDGKVDRPYVGVSIYELSTARYALRGNVNIPDDAEGIYVVEVEKNSPGEKAGIKSGDIITGIENDKVTSMAEFKYYLYKNKPKNKVKVTVLRDGKEKTLNVELGTSE